MNDEAAAQRLGKALHEDSAAPSTGQDRELLRLLRTVRVLRDPGTRRARRWLLPGAAAAAVLALAVGVTTLSSRRELTYDVRGAARIEDHRVSAESGEPVQVRFSDGSSFELSPGGRLRIDSSTPDGAHLALLDGEAMVSVVHRASSRWSVKAGPFEVAVVGTRFGTSWDAERQLLSVELHEGAVEVRGGRIGAPVLVRAGQRLQAGMSSGDWRITPLSSSPEQPVLPATPAAEATEPRVQVREQPARPAMTAAAWPTLMSRSDFATIVEQAEAMGVERCLATCSARSLRLLADAARYTGRFELAESSLLSLRRRARGQAAAAAFFLGRLYELRGRSGEALRMYQQHLGEAPRGDYAEEATAGRMRMLVRTHAAEAARKAAQDYLQRFPVGVHAASARRVLAGASTP